MQDLKPFPRLYVVDFSLNYIESLPSDLFASNEKITFVYFYNNTMKSVGTDILLPLQNLKVVNFSNNTCINMGGGTHREVSGVQAELNSKCQKL